MTYWRVDGIEQPDSWSCEATVHGRVDNVTNVDDEIVSMTASDAIEVSSSILRSYSYFYYLSNLWLVVFVSLDYALTDFLRLFLFFLRFDEVLATFWLFAWGTNKVFWFKLALVFF